MKDLNMTNRYAEFGKIMKRNRKNKKMTQKQLAELMGATQACISYWEKGKRNMTLYEFVRLFLILEMTDEELRRRGII